MNIAELFVKELEQQGVTHIFGVPGEQNIDFLEALDHSSIQFIVCRDETNAAHIAGMMGKLTGRPGVCLSTLGPGALNMTTGVACASLDRYPLIALTSQIDIPMQHDGSHQYVDMMNVFRPMVKWNASIQTGDALLDFVKEAFVDAVSEPAGAIHLELPNDVASMVAQAPLAIHKNEEELPKRVLVPSEDSLKDTANVLNQAKHPLVLIGSRAASNEISTILTDFIEKLQAPFTETYTAKGVIPGDHPLHLQTIGLPEGDYVNKAFEKADVIVTIGYDPIEYGPKKWNKEAKPIIHIDTQLFSKVDELYPMKAALIGDISQTLQALTNFIIKREKGMDPVFQSMKHAILTDDQVGETGFPLKPQHIIKQISKVLAPADLLICDVGAHKHWIARDYYAYQPNTCLFSNGLAAMGVGLPRAIGAKLAFPHKKILVVCGDGSFNMSVPELETAVRLQLPIVILVWCDGRYAAIEWEQKNKIGRATDVLFSNPNFTALAVAYGAKGYTVDESVPLEELLERAFSEDGPVVIACPVDYTENFRLSERLNKWKQGDGSRVSK